MIRGAFVLLLIHICYVRAYLPNKPVRKVTFHCADQCVIHGLKYVPALFSSKHSQVTSTTNNKGPFSTIKSFVCQMHDIFTIQLPFLQYLWPKDNVKLKLYLLLSVFFMFIGKLVNVKVPFMLQHAIDIISKGKSVTNELKYVSSASLALLFYGVSRALTVVFSEAKTCIFAHVSQNVLKKFALEIFRHLHNLDNEFHSSTPSGVISVAYVRAVRGFQTMLFQIVFSIAPTILELYLVSNILHKKCGPIFSFITLLTFTLYLSFTIWITDWRVKVRNELVEIDNSRNGYFIDSILNHEVVKLFTNQDKEEIKYNSYLEKIKQLSIESTYAIAVLNLGQALMFGAGLTASLLTACNKIQLGLMTIGELIAVNSMLLQLSIPLNFVGYTYQEIRQAYVDMGFMRHVLVDLKPNGVDNKSCNDLDMVAPRYNNPSKIEFKNVSFQYSNNDGVALLKNVSFVINPGQNVAIVGPSGSGKSTILRLITRIFSRYEGQVLLDNVDTSDVTTESLRRRIAVVPQDTSLFSGTIEYNIKYGRNNATSDEINRVIGLCNLNETINKMGLDHQVGERGVKLSGGERQKISIARALLKDPSLILCDEVTSSVDAFAEREIVETLRQATEKRTTITIAHRLSSIIHCDKIIVLDRGQVVESGSHAELLQTNGVYSKMWNAQTNNSYQSYDDEYKSMSPTNSYSNSLNAILQRRTSLNFLARPIEFSPNNVAGILKRTLLVPANADDRISDININANPENNEEQGL